jgi:hypothetical protein
MSHWLSTLPKDVSFCRLVDTAKLRWRIERDYQELKQELGLGHFEGRRWRGFHHHATLCVAAYGFLISERETIPPSGPRSATLFPELAVPDGYQPRGSAAPARASHPKLNRNHASTADRRARQKPAAMSMLQRSNRKAAARRGERRALRKRGLERWTFVITNEVGRQVGVVPFSSQSRIRKPSKLIGQEVLN